MSKDTREYWRAHAAELRVRGNAMIFNLKDATVPVTELSWWDRLRSTDYESELILCLRCNEWSSSIDAMPLRRRVDQIRTVIRKHADCRVSNEMQQRIREAGNWLVCPSANEESAAVEPSVLSDNTARTISAIGRSIAYDDLDVLLAAPPIQFEDYDPATREALRWVAANLLRGVLPSVIIHGTITPTETLDAFLSCVMNGYLVGRRLVGTHQREFLHDKGHGESDHRCRRMIDWYERLSPGRILELSSGPTERFLEDCAAQYAATSFGGRVIDNKRGPELVHHLLINGLAFAIAEFDLFSKSVAQAR